MRHWNNDIHRSIKTNYSFLKKIYYWKILIYSKIFYYLKITWMENIGSLVMKGLTTVELMTPSTDDTRHERNNCGGHVVTAQSDKAPVTACAVTVTILRRPQQLPNDGSTVARRHRGWPSFEWMSLIVPCILKDVLMFSMWPCVTEKVKSRA